MAKVSLKPTLPKQTKMKLINRILNETTCEGKTLDIYIKKSDGPSIDEWKKQGTHQYLIVFHFNNVPNKNYGFSYYIDTIMDDHWGKYENGLCLYGHKYDYASVSGEVMRRVEKFISEFVEVNGLNLHKECAV